MTFRCPRISSFHPKQMSIDNVLPQLVLMDRRRAIKNFFRTMEQDSTEAWSKHLDYLQTALLNFSDNEVEFNANMVYDMYTELNRFEDSDGKPLRNLMDTMKVYEKRASTFTESQRDHFVHSVSPYFLYVIIYLYHSRYSHKIIPPRVLSFTNKDPQKLYPEFII